jgi:hypothetical protein
VCMYVCICQLSRYIFVLVYAISCILLLYFSARFLTFLLLRLSAGLKKSFTPPSEVSDNRTITLPAGQTWPQEEGSLYVRDCYEQLMTALWNTKQKEVVHIVKGTPGVGKSVFLDYALWWLVTTKKKKVLYMYKGGKTSHMYTAGGVTTYMDLHVYPELLRSLYPQVDVVLFDPAVGNKDCLLEVTGNPYFDLAEKLVIAAVSPDKVNYGFLEHEQIHTEEWFMGPLSREEMDKMFNAGALVCVDKRFKLPSSILYYESDFG